MKNQVVEKKETKVVGKFGVTDYDGRIIVPIEYDFVNKVNDNLYIATKGSFNGLLNQVCLENSEEKSDACMDFNYVAEKENLDTDVHFYTKSGSKLKSNFNIKAVLVCKKRNMFLVLDENYKWSIALVDYVDKTIHKVGLRNYDFVKMNYHLNCFALLMKGDSVVVSFDEEKCITNVISLLNNNPVELTLNGIVIENDGKYGFINYSDITILECSFDKVIPRENHIQVIKDGYVGLLNYMGEWIVDATNYVYSKTFSLGSADLIILGSEDRKYSLYSSKRQLLDCKYDSIEVCEEFIIAKEGEIYSLYRYDNATDTITQHLPTYNADKVTISLKFLHDENGWYIGVCYCNDRPAYKVSFEELRK